MMQHEPRLAAPCPHCTPDNPPVSYAGGSFCDDLALLSDAFGVPFESPVLVGLSHASRLVCSAAGSFALSSPRRPEPSWWLVRRGCASLGRRDANGTFAERCQVGPCDWFDVTGALSTPAGWAEDAVAHRPLELLALPHAALVDACRSDVTFAQALQRVLRRRLTELRLPEDDVTQVLARHAARFDITAALS